MPVDSDRELAYTFGLVLKHDFARCITDRVPHLVVHL